MANVLPDEIYEIRDLILQSVEAEKIYLFGSYAYGTPTEDSDYDFYIVIPDAPDETLREQSNKLWSVPQKIHRASVIVEPKSYFEDIKTLPTLARKIVREGILLYDRERHSEPVVQENKVRPAAGEQSDEAGV